MQMTHDLNQTMAYTQLNSSRRTAAQIAAGLYVVALAEPSRELLAGTERWSNRVGELSSAEAVLRASVLKLARARDRWVAWSTLPEDVREEYASEREAAFVNQGGEFDVVTTMVQLLVPAVDAAQRAGLRSQQQHHLLASIEALRMHAAQTGQLPETLQKLRPVPAWQDALARQPFEYKRTSPTEAILTRTARFPDDNETTFQIQLREKP